MAKPTYNEVNALSSIAHDTTITGDIQSDGDFRLDGVLNGNLFCKGRVVLGPESKIIGEIHSNSAEIGGNVLGEITINDLLSLKSTAVITGDLIMGRFSVEPGARFTGVCKMNREEKPSLDYDSVGNNTENA